MPAIIGWEGWQCAICVFGSQSSGWAQTLLSMLEWTWMQRPCVVFEKVLLCNLKASSVVIAEGWTVQFLSQFLILASEEWMWNARSMVEIMPGKWKGIWHGFRNLFWLFFCFRGWWYIYEGVLLSKTRLDAAMVLLRGLLCLQDIFQTEQLHLNEQKQLVWIQGASFCYERIPSRMEGWLCKSERVKV